MGSVQLGTKAVGSIVKLKVNGTLREFIVGHQGLPSSLYDASCNGTWLVMKDIYTTGQWNSYNNNDYAASTVNALLNGTFLDQLDPSVRAQVKTVQLPYVSGTVKAFLLSATEIGITTDPYFLITQDGAKLDYFIAGRDNNSAADNRRITYLNGSALDWWLRSKCGSNGTGVWLIRPTGRHTCSDSNCTYTFGIRPTMILPFDILASDDGTITGNTAPTMPISITVPETIQGGSAITVQWAASTDAENNLEGYELESSTDGGSSWNNIYKGNALSTTNTVPFGTGTVMYRVRAYDSEGLYSSYRTSAQQTVINNAAPGAPASITVPVEVLGGSSLTVAWGAAADQDGNLAGYALERQVDGGSWEEVYRGENLTYADAVTRGWESVSYRVRAYDSYTAYSGYTTSPARQVNNNIAPVITCGQASGTDLGTKSAGFSVDYSASDADGDDVTVTEAIDGEAVRTFAAEAGESYAFHVTGETWMKLLNGAHELTVSASDGQVTALHKLSFTKAVTSAAITLSEPVEADAKITICVLSVSGDIPADATFSVKVTNNALDEAPVWEDCTTEVKTGANHIFTNETAVSGFAFNFKVEVERGESGQGGYINSVQGGFQ